ncbi:uncharacterized protein [Amphiura filiformis]
MNILDTLFTIKDLIEIGVDVYYRVQAVREDFAEGKERLVLELGIIVETLQKYEKLEGKISLQSDIGKASSYMHKRIKEADAYLDKFDKKGKLKKFVTKSNIDEKFNSLTDDLRSAFDLLSNAIKPYLLQQGVKEREFAIPVESQVHAVVINSGDLEEQYPLGQGRFGVVFLADYKHGGQVAVKKFPIQAAQKEIQKEVRKMWRVISCPNLVRILGYTNEPEHLSIVMEYYENGDLKDFNGRYMMDSDCMPRKIRMIHEMTWGINYLHSLNPAIIHSDLKLANTFVGAGLTVKIGDFGLAISETSTSAHDLRGTISHIPPEAYSENNKTPDKCWDIFTFGISLFEFISGQDPWPEEVNSGYIIGCMLQGKRPNDDAIPVYTPVELVDIMKRCWDGEPTKRPCSEEIQELISDIYQKTFKTELHTADTKVYQKMSADIDKLSDKMKRLGISITVPPPYGDEVKKTNQANGCLININRGRKNIYSMLMENTKAEDLSLDSEETFVMLCPTTSLAVNNDAHHCQLKPQTGSNEQAFLFDAGRLRWKKDPTKVLGYRVLGDEYGGLYLKEEKPNDDGQKFVYNKKTNRWSVAVKKNSNYHQYYIITDEVDVGGSVYVKDTNSSFCHYSFPMVSTAKPATIEIEFDKTAAKTQLAPITVFTTTECNNTSSASIFRVQQSQIATTNNKSEFLWNNKLNVPPSTTFTAQVPLFSEDKVEFGPNETFEIGKSKIASKSEDKQWSLDTPITIGPYTKVTLSLVVWQGTVEVPFKAKIIQGEYKWIEQGTYTGVSGMRLEVNRNEEALSE